jgi:small-conductance mechanosensitive channel
MEQWNNILELILQRLQVFATVNAWLQLGLVALAGLVAWLLHRRWERYLQSQEGGSGRLRHFTLRSSLRIIFPISMLLVILLERAVLTQTGQSAALLSVAIPLLLSLAVIRFSVFMLRKVFPPSRALKAWESVISTTMWVLVAMHLVGWLPGIIKSLDEFAFQLGDTRVSLLAAIKLVISVAVFLMLALWLSRVIERRITRSQHMGAGVQVAVAKVSKLFLLTMAVLISLDAVGIDLTALTVFGGALGVGLGFGLQRIASNFVSGFILIFDRSIKPGDVITIGTKFGWVQELRARYIVVRDRDGVETLIPNENLVTSEVINWSYTDPNVRVKIPLQVSYDDDPKQAMDLMLQAAKICTRVLQNPEPVCRLIEFGDNGITLELRVWIADPQNGFANVRTDIYLEIWRLFKEAGITIPYPQRDVYIKSQVVPTVSQ